MSYIKTTSRPWALNSGGSAAGGGDVFSLLSSHPETNPQGKKLPSANRTSGKNDDQEWVKEQESTFIQWINEHLKNSDHQTSITDLRSGLQDGLVLIELMRIVAPESIQFIRYHKNPKLRLLRLENVKIALECMKREKIQLLNIEPADIVDGNLKLTLGLLQTLANHYPITSAGNVVHKAATKKAMMQWLQGFLPKSKITNFTTDWNNGILLCALVDTLRPGLVPDLSSLRSANARANTQRALDLAEKHFDIPKTVGVDALCTAAPKELTVTTYLSYFCGPESPGHERMINWFNEMVPDHQIINFASDWLDGMMLCYLMTAICEPGVIPDEDTLLKQSPTDRVKVAMETAEQELGVTSSLRPAQFTSKTTEPLQRMAYVTQFMRHRRYSSVSPVSDIMINQVDGNGEPRPSSEDNEPHPSSDDNEPDLTNESCPSNNSNDSRPSSHNSTSHDSTGPRPSTSSNIGSEDGSEVESNGLNNKLIVVSPKTKRTSKVDELLAAFELDFDDVLKQIDNIGGNPPKEDESEKEGDVTVNPSTAQTEGTVLNPTTAQKEVPIELDFDFDFSSDTGNSSEVGSRPHSVTPDPAKGAAALIHVMTGEGSGKDEEGSGEEDEVDQQQQVEDEEDEIELVNGEGQQRDEVDELHIEEEHADGKRAEETENELVQQHHQQKEDDQLMQGQEIEEDNVQRVHEAPENDIVDNDAVEDGSTGVEKDTAVEDGIHEGTVGDSSTGDSIMVEDSGNTVTDSSPVVVGGATVSPDDNESVEGDHSESMHHHHDDTSAVTEGGDDITVKVQTLPTMIIEEVIIEEVIVDEATPLIEDTLHNEANLLDEDPLPNKDESVDESTPLDKVTIISETTPLNDDPLVAVIPSSRTPPGSHTDSHTGSHSASPRSRSISPTNSHSASPIESHTDSHTGSHSDSRPRSRSASPTDSLSFSPILPEDPPYDDEGVDLPLDKATVMSDPSQCDVSGRGLYYGVVGVAGSFIVDCTKAGRGRLEVIIESPTGLNLEADGSQIKDSVFEVLFTPNEVGTHKIFVQFHERDVPNSPFSCEVCDPLACAVAGVGGIQECRVGVPCIFRVRTDGAGAGTLQTSIDGVAPPTDFQLVSCVEGLYTYQYMVPCAGEYEIEVKWVGHHIPGSPFRVTAVDDRPKSTACAIVGQPLENVRVRDEIKVKVDCTGAGKGELKALLQSPSRGEIACDISLEGQVYTVSTRPSDVGDHRLVIQYGGEDIPGSPVLIQANDPSLIKLNVQTQIIQSVPFHKQFVFHVNTFKCGGVGHVTAQATPSDAPHRPINLDIKSNQHEHTLTYLPTTLGIHSIQVLYNNRPCLATPISLKVYDVNSLQDIVLTKTLPAQGTQHLLNKLLTFQLSAPNREKADIFFNAVGLHTGHTPHLAIEPTTDSSFSLEFKASKPDDYKISVMYKGEHVQGSPFTLPIRPPVRANKVTMYDPVIPLVASKPIELVFDTSQAGHGVISASVLNSRKKLMPVYVEQVNDTIFRVAFIPKESGSFMVSVLYADKHIGGSPFRVLYQEQVKEPSVCVNFHPDMVIKGLMGSAVYGRNSGRQEATVVQYERGKYQISFIPQTPDTFDLHVYWFDTEIEGSPFEIDLSGGLENESSDALVDSVPIAVGESVGILAATSVGHKNGPVPIKITPVDDSVCHIEFTSLSPDKYDLNVFWNNKILCGMPIVLPLD